MTDSRKKGGNTYLCTRGECASNVGKWVQFQTQWGVHKGIISDVNDRAVLVRVPRPYAPTGLASAHQEVDKDDVAKLDLALAQWGAGYGYGYGGYGRPGYGRYGAGWGRPGYGGWYGGWWWWLAFAWIWWLWFLW